MKSNKNHFDNFLDCRSNKRGAINTLVILIIILAMVIVGSGGYIYYLATSSSSSGSNSLSLSSNTPSPSSNYPTPDLNASISITPTAALTPSTSTQLQKNLNSTSGGQRALMDTSYTTVGSLICVPDNTYVHLTNRIVTAVFNPDPGYIYITDTNYIGMRVETDNTSLTPGDVVNVDGAMITVLFNLNRVERDIDAVDPTDAVPNPGVTKVASGPKPHVAIVNGWSVGGGAYNSSACPNPENSIIPVREGLAGRGTVATDPYNSIGLFNIGTLAKVYGKVTSIDSSRNVFWIDDGSGVTSYPFDNQTRIGVEVGYPGPIPSGIHVGAFVYVTGIITTKLAPDWNASVRFVQMRTTGDITY